MIEDDTELTLKPKAGTQCPQCSMPIPNGGIFCTDCGFNRETGERLGKAESPPSGAGDSLMPPLQQIDHEAGISLVIGGVMAIVVCAIPFVNFIAGYLRILIHEFGHSLFAWGLGFPAVPAFDFVNGGGVASYFNEHPKWYLIAGMYGFIGWLLWLNRKSKAGVIIFSICLVIYAITAHTSLNKIVISGMGHGVELIIGGIFLYRAISGSLIHSAEQPIYAFCGFYLVFSDLIFGWKLIFDRAYRLSYLHHPAGLTNDFIKISQTLNISLTTIAWLLIFLCLLPPAGAFLLHRYRQYI